MAEKHKNEFKIFVYCLMPDHLHLLLSPTVQKISVSKFIGAFKSKSTRIAWDFGIVGKLWQRRFHDHIVRTQGDLKNIGQYILDNPVRGGLSVRWQNYQYLGLIDSWY